jgi:hypothetical protein
MVVSVVLRFGVHAVAAAMVVARTADEKTVIDASAG